MKTKKKNNNKYVIRRILALVILIFFLTFLIKTVKGHKFPSYKTVFPTYTTFEEDIPVTVYNILHEEVYFAEGNGIAVFNASEGQKIPVNYEIASINLMEDVSELKDELQKVKAAIEYKTTGKDEKKEISITFDDSIQKAIRDRNFEQAIGSINDLDLGSHSNINLSDIKDLIKLSDDELENRKSSLVEKISQSNVSYLSKFTGIVSYKIDGLEQYFTNQPLKTYTDKYLKNHSQIESFAVNTEVKKAEPIFKLIDNLSWKAALLIEDSSKIKDYSPGDTINVEVLNGQILRGDIVQINKSKRSPVYIIDVDSMLNEMYSKRIHEGKIIVDKTKGFEIPSSALISRNHMTGVYVQEIKGLVKFLPVEIIREEHEKIFVGKGNREGRIEINDKEYKTLTINDAIVINPRTVEESRVLN
ncbi:MAG: HlyD family efflux transporter periplasmic adaptor subunit [Tissierellia bacterium]|nr:HlyD family efflux transporter periplasmic adaptor subunit [Tissierellia bacterium]